MTQQEQRDKREELKTQLRGVRDMSISEDSAEEEAVTTRAANKREVLLDCGIGVVDDQCDMLLA